MKKLSIAIFGLVFLLFGCESEKYKGSIENGEIALSEKRYDEAIYSFKIALDEKPNDEKATKGLEKAEKEAKKKEKERKQKEEAEAEQKKKIEEEKKAAEETKKREEQQKREEEKQKKADKLNEVVQELINMGEGSILDIKPTSGDDWIATYVYIDNSWYLLSEEEKKYVVENIGPVVESKIIETGVVDYCDVYFVDQNGNTVASPKMFGGYKINN